MKCRAYVIEDNPALRDTLIDALSEVADIQTVGFADNDREAIAWLTNPANGWDIAVVDLNLGAGGTGYKVLSMCCHRPPEQWMAVLTGTNDPIINARCLALGADAVFDRAYDVQTLLDFCSSFAQQLARGAKIVSARQPVGAAPSSVFDGLLNVGGKPAA